MPISFIFYRPQRSWGKVIFSQVSVTLSTGVGVCGCRGGCVVAGGHVWLLGGHAWLLGGMHGCWGVCMVAGGVHGCRGACVAVEGMHGCGGCAWWWWGACVGYDEIRSMSGRYASYWNAFLFKILKKVNLVSHCVVVPVFGNYEDTCDGMSYMFPQSKNNW